MKFETILSLLSLSALAFGQAPETGDPSTTTGALGDAKPFLNNPLGKVYVASFTGAGKVQGSIKFSSAPDGDAVHVNVTLTGFPASGGPFAYHIHDAPVAANGNCTSTLAHLDPYQRGQKVPCDNSKPQTCEVGDLAGKHGKIPMDQGNNTYSKSYIDQYITLEKGVGSFIGNRSVVIHLANSTRIACANLSDGVYVPPPGQDNSGSKYGPGLWGCGLGAAVGLRLLLV